MTDKVRAATRCPHCEKVVKAPIEWVGKSVRCPGCQANFTISSFVVDAPAGPTVEVNSVASSDLSATVRSASSDGRSSLVAKEPTTGTIGRFQLKQVIGSGGFGVVYRARDPALSRVVALKIPRFAATDSKRMRRFTAEARAAARLRHPHIVAVYECGQVGKQPFIAYEFVAGKTLSACIDSEKPPYALTAKWVKDLAEALHYAHSDGVVHRDIKPDNILVNERDQPQILDFGLARRDDDDSGQTVEGSILGTPAYMAPEQARGEIAQVGPRSDQYSLGVVLYQALTGRKPFEGSPHVVMAKVVGEEPPAPSSIDPGTPPDLQSICLKAMSKDPAHRYADCAEFADDLGRYLRHEPTQARPVGTIERFRRWCRREPVIATLGSLVAVSVILGSLVSIGFAVSAGREAVRARNAEQVAKDREAEARTAKNEATANAEAARAAERVAEQRARAEEKAKQDALAEKARADQQADEARMQKDLADANWRRAEDQLYAGHIALAQASWQENYVEEALGRLSACQTESRGWEHQYLEHLLQMNQRTLRVEIPTPGPHRAYQNSPIRSIAFSPDGTQIVSGGNDRMVRLWEAATGTEIRSFPGHTADILSVAFSSDGRRILSGGNDKTLRVWDVASGQPALPPLEQAFLVYGVGWSAAGDRIAACGGAPAGPKSEGIAIWDAKTGRKQLDLAFSNSNGGGRSWSLAFSPDGTRIVCGGDQTAVWNATTGSEIIQMPRLSSVVQCVAFSPDGKRIASAGADRVTYVRDAKTGDVISTLQGHTSIVYGVAFHPDGKLLATCGRDGSVRLWEVESGRELAILRGHLKEVMCVQFSPDGRRIASADWSGAIHLWNTDARQEALTLEAHEAGVTSVAFSADGSQIASGCGFGGDLQQERGVRIWDSGSGRQLLLLRSPSLGTRQVAFSPDGEQVAVAANPAMVWDLKDGRELWAIRDRVSTNGVAYAPHGGRIAVATQDGTVSVHDASTGNELSSFFLRDPSRTHGNDVHTIAFSPDGTRIACGQHAANATVIDAMTGEAVLSLKERPKTTVYSVAFSPDGTRLARAGEDRLIKIWDAATGDALLTLTGHLGPVHSIAFHPDGIRLASGSDDRTIRIWDAKTGRETMTLKGHEAEVTSVAFSPDGWRLVSGSFDRTVKVWDARPWTSDVQAEFEAVQVVGFYRRTLPAEKLENALRADRTISEPVREKALMLTKTGRLIPASPPKGTVVPHYRMPPPRPVAFPPTAQSGR